MAQRTHGQNTLLFGSQNGLCDECSFKFKQTDLRKRWDNLMVCRDCWEPEHPSQLYNYRARDNGGGAGGGTRTDDSGEGTGTSIDGTPIPPSIGAIVITTTSLGTIIDGVAFSLQIETDITPEAPAVWTITAGALPTGLVLGGSTGIVSGIPTVGNESYTLTIQVVDAFGRTDTQAYSGTTIYGVPTAWAGPFASSATSVSPNFGLNTTSDAIVDGKPFQNGCASTKVYTEGTDTWSTVTHQATACGIYGYGKVLSDGNFYALISKSTSKYDYVLDSWSNIASTEPNTDVRYSLAKLPDGSQYEMICSGGRRSGAIGHVDTYGFDIVTQNWAVLADLPLPLLYHISVGLSDGRVLVGGGSADGGATNNLRYWFFDPLLGTYTETTSIDSARAKWMPVCQMQLPSGLVYIAGGGTSLGGGSVQANTFDLDTETWTIEADLPISDWDPSGSGSSTLMPDGRVFLMSGQSTKDSYMQDVS